jgi:LysR family glycine cleavage system transcriptional activator
MQIGAPHDPDLYVELMFELKMFPVCSPRVAAEARLSTPADLLRVALIHDDSLAGRAHLPSWSQWLEKAGVKGVNGADLSRGLRFNSADHAIEATVEGAGVLLCHSVLALDDLRTARLVKPFDLTLDTGRGFHFVCPKGNERRSKVKAFRDWLRLERDRTLEVAAEPVPSAPPDPLSDAGSPARGSPKARQRAR